MNKTLLLSQATDAEDILTKYFVSGATSEINKDLNCVLELVHQIRMGLQDDNS